jgi:hypothetical protein
MDRISDASARIRRSVLNIAGRHQVPGTGSASLKPSERYRMEWPDLTAVLRGIHWAVVGGVATRRYMPERHTDDLDIAVLPRDRNAVEDRLRRAGFELQGQLELPFGGSQWRTPEGVSVDVIALGRPWGEQALAAAAGNTKPDGVPVLTLPFLIVMKIDSGRTSDGFDVSRMLAAASEDDRTVVLSAVRRWLPADVDDIESMIAFARLESGDESSPAP